LETLLPDTQNTRIVVRVLNLDAMNRAEKEDCSSALDDCRAMLGCSAAIGEEPIMISQLVRIAIAGVAVATMERVLGQGEASEGSLAQLQERFAREGECPYGLIGLRGERASFFDITDKLARGVLPFSALSDNSRPTGPVATTTTPHGRAMFLSNQAIGLRLLNQAGEIAKQPAERRGPMIVEWIAERERIRKDPIVFRHMLASLMTPAVEAFVNAEQRIKGQLGVGQVMIAMERFRIANGRWAESLSEIPASILASAPVDPFDGKPIKLKRVDDGWVVYCVGPDGVDNQGKLDERFRPEAKGTDWGLRLWDPAARRQSMPLAEAVPGRQ
jgi:hypothetical protein